MTSDPDRRDSIDPRDLNTPPPAEDAPGEPGVLATIGTVFLVICTAAQLYLMVEHLEWLRRPPSEGHAWAGLGMGILAFLWTIPSIVASIVALVRAAACIEHRRPAMALLYAAVALLPVALWYVLGISQPPPRLDLP